MGRLTYTIAASVKELPPNWDKVGNDIFLDTAYLTAQEVASPSNMDYFYVSIFKHDQLSGKFVIQRIKLNGGSVFNHELGFKEVVLNLLNLNLLCVGNIKLSGEHAWALNSETELSEFTGLLFEVLEEVRIISKKQRLPVQLMLIKDFYSGTATEIAPFLQDFEKLAVQPNMVFSARKEWKHQNDFLSAMRTKYRTRAKRAFKKAQSMEFRELNAEDLDNLNSKIYELYLNVLRNNSFSLYTLPKNFFYEMKKNMPDNFKIFAGFIDKELVCFYSLILHGKNLEAGFLGYDADIQQEKQLYLNMLYRMIEFAIENKVEHIDMSRTALEIKSSVGAAPLEMFGFLKHTNPMMNRILGAVFRMYYRPEKWIQRKPFK